MADVTSRGDRRRRSNGDESRERILDAATEIAAMRGYSGTSMAAVSKLSGLPPSSIYWHFDDKDDLIAAVIERGYGRWIAAVTVPADYSTGAAGAEDYARVLARQVMRSLVRAPDFLRLGLMLVLERPTDEPKARRMFLRVRADARTLVRENFGAAYPDLSATARQRLADFALAAADGLFIAHQAADRTGDDTAGAADPEDALRASFDLLALSVADLAEKLGRQP